MDDRRRCRRADWILERLCDVDINSARRTSAPQARAHRHLTRLRYRRARSPIAHSPTVSSTALPRPARITPSVAELNTDGARRRRRTGRRGGRLLARRALSRRHGHPAEYYFCARRRAATGSRHGPCTSSRRWASGLVELHEFHCYTGPRAMGAGRALELEWPSPSHLSQLRLCRAMGAAPSTRWLPPMRWPLAPSCSRARSRAPDRRPRFFVCARHRQLQGRLLLLTSGPSSRSSPMAPAAGSAARSEPRVPATGRTLWRSARIGRVRRARRPVDRVGARRQGPEDAPRRRATAAFSRSATAPPTLCWSRRRRSVTSRASTPPTSSTPTPARSPIAGRSTPTSPSAGRRAAAFRWAAASAEGRADLPRGRRRRRQREPVQTPRPSTMCTRGAGADVIHEVLTEGDVSACSAT